jgi:hypothetical protein
MGAMMTISGAADKTLTASRGLENHGTVHWTGGRLLINDAADFRNESSGVFNVSGGIDMDTTSQTGGTFTNRGEFRKTSGGPTRINRTRFNTEGDVFIDAGELDLAGGGASESVFHIASGAGLLFGTNAPHQLYTLNTLTEFNGPGFARVTGAVSIPPGESVVAERFHVDGGSVIGGGMLLMEEEFKFTAGLLSGGTTKIEAGGVWMLSGAADKQLAGGHTVDVFGDATWQGTGQLLVNGISHVRIRPGANVDVQSDLTIDSGIFPAGAIDVEGMLSRSTSSGVARLARTLLNNQGVVSVSTGTLQVAGGGTSTGNFSIAQGAVVEFPAGSAYTLGAGTTMTGTGFAQLGGTLAVPTAAVAMIDQLDFRSGSFFGPGTLAINDQMLLGGASNKTFDGLIVENHGDAMWTGAGMVLTNNGAIFNNRTDGAFYAETDGVIDSNDFPAGTFNNSGALIKQDSAGTTRFFRMELNNSGLVDVQSGTLRLESGGTHSGSFQMAGGTSTHLAVGLHTLASGAQFGGSGLLRLNGGIAQVPAAAAVSMHNVDLTAGALNVDGPLTVGGVFNWTGGALSINNAGSITNTGVNTFNASVSATVTHSGAATSHFVNVGAFQKTASTGTTRFGGGVAYDNSGVTNVGAGSTLQLSGGGLSSGPFQVDAGGVLLVDGVTPYVWNGGTVIDGSGFARVTGLVHTPSGATASVERLQLFGGTLAQAGVVQVSGDFTWTFGTLSTGTLSVAPGATATIAGVLTMTLSGSTLANHGTLTWTSGSISSASSPTINNHLGAAFDIKTNASLIGAGALNNDGLLTKTAGGGTSLLGFATTNTGVIEAANGTVQFSGGFSQTAGATRLVGGNLAASTPMNFFAGALVGSGTILGQVNNLGATVSPGLSAGLLQVTGYSQAPTGFLRIEITGTSPSQFDRLETSAGATLGGTLDVSLLGFKPAPTDTFAVLTAAGGLSGAFANAASGQRVFTSDGHGSFLVHYGPGSPFDPNQVVLSQFFLSADFDEDGDDLANWNAGFGTSGPATTHMQGNADGDLDVDGADFLTWQRQLGSASTAVADSMAVPETKSIWMAAASLLIRRRAASRC